MDTKNEKVVNSKKEVTGMNSNNWEKEYLVGLGSDKLEPLLIDDFFKKIDERKGQISLTIKHAGPILNYATVLSLAKAGVEFKLPEKDKVNEEIKFLCSGDSKKGYTPRDAAILVVSLFVNQANKSHDGHTRQVEASQKNKEAAMGQLVEQLGNCIPWFLHRAVVAKHKDGAKYSNVLKAEECKKRAMEALDHLKGLDKAEKPKAEGKPKTDKKAPDKPKEKIDTSSLPGGELIGKTQTI